jgi:superfamily II DNA or RNA helicase
MTVLHAHWQPARAADDPGSVWLWAESAVGPPPPAQRGRMAAVPKQHPFCLSAEDLAQLPALAAFLDFALDSPAAANNSAVFTLRLPSTRTGPLPSPRLWHDWPLDERTEPFLAPWQIPGLRLDPARAAGLLSALVSEGPDASGLHLGEDLRFWQQATGLALEGVAAQKLLPLFIPMGDGAHARWLLVLDGPGDGPRLARLAQAMPPVCRAALQVEALKQAASPSDTSPDTSSSEALAPSPRRLLTSYLNAVADGLLREAGRGLPAEGWVLAASEAGEPHRVWLDALLAEAPDFALPRIQLAAMQEAQQAWLRNLQVAGDERFRIAMRLEAPLQQAAADGTSAGAGSTNAAWRLHFLLESREDPSLLVPATALWARGRRQAWLAGAASGLQEQLLAGLAFAGRVFPPIAEGLRGRQPEDLELDTGEAYRFLREAAPLLESAGFSLHVPPWWHRAGSRLGLRLKLRGRGSSAASEAGIGPGHLSMDRLVDFKWELALGEERLERADFEAMVALKQPLLQIRGQWVRLDPDQIEAAIRFWDAEDAAGSFELQEALRLGLDEGQEMAGLPIEGVEAEGWLADWLGRLREPARMEAITVPAGLDATLRPYQQQGLSWLSFLRRAELGACLADDMGLGKTIQTISLILAEGERMGGLPGPSLLVCPTSVVTNWQRELARFAPSLRLLLHQGPDRLAGEALAEALEGVDVVLTSYALLRRDIEDLSERAWYVLALDEAQNIKNPAALQSRAARRLQASFRIALTGTPVENRLSELWSIMQFLNPGFLGSRRSFRKTYALPIEGYGDEAAAQRLRGLVGPFILRRLKTDPTVIDDLPEKIESRAYCQLSEEQATLYQAVVDESLRQVAESEGIERRGQVLSMLMQLKQICNHPLQYLHQGDAAGQEHRAVVARSGKLQRLIELLEEMLEVGDRALIFTQFTEMGRLLQTQLPQALGVRALYLHGGQRAAERDAQVQAFQAEDGPPIFILSLKAGGTGLNLTAANQVFHFDRWWNPAVEDQATDRAFRIGQTRRVQVHKFVALGTLEERIDRMIEDKRALAESVVGSGESWLTELSTESLRDLVRLRREGDSDG